MSLYQLSVVQMSKMLRTLDACLDKAAAFAEAKGSKPDDLVSFSLTFDMKPLAFQIQSACDSAKFAAARLTGVEPPVNPDTETTLAQLKARIASTLEFVGTFEEKQFEGAERRDVQLSFLPGQGIYGSDYMNELVLPNFYFHVTMAYALLRQSGVSLGKMDFLGGLTLHPVSS
jgi:uncharacterized protein